MDPQQIQGKVQIFAQRLLEEAQGDPVRALGLLVLVLDDSDTASSDHVSRLLSEVRKILLPGVEAIGHRPIRHLAGDPSWEGVQHCLRCAKVLARNCRTGGDGFPTGYVFQIGTQFTIDDYEDYDPCL